MKSPFFPMVSPFLQRFPSYGCHQVKAAAKAEPKAKAKAAVNFLGLYATSFIRDGWFTSDRKLTWGNLMKFEWSMFQKWKNQTHQWWIVWWFARYGKLTQQGKITRRVFEIVVIFLGLVLSWFIGDGWWIIGTIFLFIPLFYCNSQRRVSIFTLPLSVTVPTDNPLL